MRKIDETLAAKRKNKILHAAVHHYIKTGIPASSKVLVGDYGIKCSSATVRNILAELEDEGYLAQIHTSSGRVPTDKGYRAYVDMLEGVRRKAIDERKRIEEIYEGRMAELEEVIINTSRILSRLSHYSGFVSLPAKEQTKIQDVEILRVPPDGKTLFIIVTNTGLVRHKLLPFDLSSNRAEFRYICDYLKEKLSGVTLEEARNALESIVEEIRQRHTRFIEDISRAVMDAFDYEKDFYIEGISNILTLPEFKGLEVPDFLLGSDDVSSEGESNKYKNILSRVIKENLASSTDDEVKVIIGSESKYKGMESIAAVLRPYKKDSRPIGVLGILGPKRMEYRKMMEIVINVSRTLEDMLKKI